MTPLRLGRATLLGGDCLDLLRSTPDASVDAVVTDPPAGIEFMGRSWDNFKAARPTASGVQSEAWGGFGNPYAREATPRFTGKSARDTGARDNFVAFMAEVMAECLRVLRPGGHAVVWALPRTSHWTATAIEDAGFEVRDVVTHIFGTGFPKSLDVSRAIDKTAGAKREVVGRNPNYRDADKNAEHHERWNAAVMSADATAPATEDAARWRGWGTALKPASEHWILARRPLSEPSVAANVLAHGTGALNIDGSRIGFAGRQDEEAAFPGGRLTSHGKGHLAGPGAAQEVVRTEFAAARSQGRWPANLVLSHLAGCEVVGLRRLPANGPADPTRINRTTDLKEGYGTGKGFTNTEMIYGYGDGDGTEEVEDWRCAEGCPVAELDRQSGQRRGGGVTTGAEPSRIGGNGIYGAFPHGNAHDGYDDLGGASRFFYVAKASRAERSAGLDGFKERPLLWSSGTQSPGTFQADGTRREARNFHPTVKPVALMRHLCKLVTPPGGLVLDPFCGSGSTGVAALAEGFRFLGMEREQDYLDIAAARLRLAAESAPAGTEVEVVPAPAPPLAAPADEQLGFPDA